MLINTNDSLFIKRCKDFNLILDSMQIFGEIIVLKNTIGKYVFMDKNFNILYIGNSCYKYCTLLQDIACQISYDYQMFVPFKNFSLAQILNLATSLNVYTGEYSAEEKQYIYRLLNLFAFIREEINRYFKDMYPMICMNIGIVDVFAYIEALITRINRVIEEGMATGNISEEMVLQAIGRQDLSTHLKPRVQEIIRLLVDYKNVDTQEVDHKLKSKLKNDNLGEGIGR